MAKITITHPHSLSQEEVRQRIEALFQDYKERFGVNTRWAGDTLNLDGPGFEGQARVSVDKVDVDVKLGLMASAFKGQVESGIKHELEKRLKA